MSTIALIERLFPPSERMNLLLATGTPEWDVSPVRKRRRLSHDECCVFKEGSHNLANGIASNSASDRSSQCNDEGSIVDYVERLVEDCPKLAGLTRKEEIKKSVRPAICVPEW